MFSIGTCVKMERSNGVDTGRICGTAVCHNNQVYYVVKLDQPGYLFCQDPVSTHPLQYSKQTSFVDMILAHPDSVKEIAL